MGKNQKKLYDSYVHVVDDIKQTTISHALRYVEDGRHNDATERRFQGMSALEGVSKTAIWTLDNSKLRDKVLDYAHAAWCELLRL